MENDKTYKTCDAKYAAKKALKAFKKNDLTDSRLADYLLTIYSFSDESKNPKLKERTQRVINYLTMGEGSFSDIVATIEKILEQLSIMNEKQSVMECRKRAASNHFRRSLATRTFEESPSELNVFDVIKVPTMGGMHLSVVADISDGMVTCYPMTTACRKDLGLIGTKSILLDSCEDERYDGVRITSAATRIPVEDARRSYAGSVANYPSISNILSKVAAFA